MSDEATRPGISGRSAPRHCLGLTLLELLVVLAITALLTTIGVPSFREYVQNQRLKAAVAALHSDLVRARTEAVHLVQRVVACPAAADGGCLDEPAWERGWRVFVDLDGDREHQDGEPVLRRAPPVEFVTIRSATTRRRLRFDPTGAAPATNATIRFCDERGAEKAWQLKLSNTGRIRRLRPGEDAPTAC